METPMAARGDANSDDGQLLIVGSCEEAETVESTVPCRPSHAPALCVLRRRIQAMLARSLEASGRGEEALECFAQLLHFHPENGEARHAIPRLAAGVEADKAWKTRGDDDDGNESDGDGNNGVGGGDVRHHDRAHCGDAPKAHGKEQQTDEPMKAMETDDGGEHLLSALPLCLWSPQKKPASAAVSTAAVVVVAAVV